MLAFASSRLLALALALALCAPSPRARIFGYLVNVRARVGVLLPYLLSTYLPTTYLNTPAFHPETLFRKISHIQKRVATSRLTNLCCVHAFTGHEARQATRGGTTCSVTLKITLARASSYSACQDFSRETKTGDRHLCSVCKCDVVVVAHTNVRRGSGRFDEMNCGDLSVAGF